MEKFDSSERTSAIDSGQEQGITDEKLASIKNAPPLNIMGELITKRHLGLCNGDAELLKQVYSSPNNTRLLADLDYVRENPDIVCTVTASIGGNPINVQKGTTQEGLETLNFDYPYVDELGVFKWQNAGLIYDKVWQINTVVDIPDPTRSTS